MSNYTFLLEDEIEELDIKYSTKRPNNNDFGPFLDKKILFGYDFIDLDKTDYHFFQDCLDNKDVKVYFQRVKALSSKTLNDLIDNSSHDEHFHIYNNPTKKQKQLLGAIFGEEAFKDAYPGIAQIALYTEKELASRTEQIKSPRIYFLIGPWAVLYILFYDPYHEVNPNIQNADSDLNKST